MIFVGTASAKPSAEQQTKCIQELGTYKNAKGKQVLKGKELTKVCQKNGNDKFLECISLTERTLSLKTATTFCSKKPNTQAQKCVQDLGAYKTKGKPELAGNKLINICKRNSADKFLACVASTQRTLKKVSMAARFCEGKPSVQAQKCVKELGSYKTAKGKTALKENQLVKVCRSHSSEKFLSCVASTQKSLDGIRASISSCGKLSNRMPASR